MPAPTLTLRKLQMIQTIAPKALIFDFDGTIADTQNTFIAIANRLAPQFGYRPLEPEQIDALRNLHSRAVIKASGLPLYKLPFFLHRAKRELRKEIQGVQPIAGMVEALQDLRDGGYRLGIITSNLQENVAFFLEVNQLQHLFEFAYSGITIFGKSRTIRRALRELQLAPTEAIYLGDETRDIEAARRSQVAAVAVGWGFNSRTALLEMEPDALVERPQDISRTIAALRGLESASVPRRAP